MFDFVRAEWGGGGQAIFSSGTAHSRGVAMLFDSKFGFDVHRTEIDSDGNFIILDVVLCCVRPSPGRLEPRVQHLDYIDQMGRMAAGVAPYHR